MGRFKVFIYKTGVFLNTSESGGISRREHEIKDIREEYRRRDVEVASLNDI